MKLSRQNKLVRFAYTMPWPWHHVTGEKLYIPYDVSLCPFFWRVMFRIPLWILSTAALPVVGVTFVMLWLTGEVGGRIPSRKEGGFLDLAANYLEAKKKKVCPIIKLE